MLCFWFCFPMHTQLSTSRKPWTASLRPAALPASPLLRSAPSLENKGDLDTASGAVAAGLTTQVATERPTGGAAHCAEMLDAARSPVPGRKAREGARFHAAFSGQREMQSFRIVRFRNFPLNVFRQQLTVFT